MESIFPKELTKKEFARDLDRIETMTSRKNFSAFFKGCDIVLFDCETFKGMKVIEGTKIKDIEAFDDTWKAWIRKGMNILMYRKYEDFPDERAVRLLQLKYLTQTDRKRLRHKFRFIPQDAYLLTSIDIREDGEIQPIQMVIIQIGTEIRLLDIDRRFCKEATQKYEDYGYDFKQFADEAQEIVDLTPDLLDMSFVQYTKDDINFFIPLPSKSLPKTFKSRTKYGDRIVHEVKNHTRNQVSDVRRHLRGTGTIEMDGVKYEIICGLDLTMRAGSHLFKRAG